MVSFVGPKNWRVSEEALAYSRRCFTFGDGDDDIKRKKRKRQGSVYRSHGSVLARRDRYQVSNVA